MAKVVDKNHSARFTGQFTVVAQVEFRIDSLDTKERRTAIARKCRLRRRIEREMKEGKQFKSIVS